MTSKIHKWFFLFLFICCYISRPMFRVCSVTVLDWLGVECAERKV